MNPFTALAHLFAKLGKKVATLLRIIGSMVTDEQIILALEFVRQASTRFTENEARRAWVAAMIRSKLKVSDSFANLLTELAVQAFKKQLAAGVDKLEDLLTDDPNPPQEPA